MGINITINGKSATATKNNSELDRSVLDAIIEGIKKTIGATVTLREAQQITLHVMGTDLQSLTFDLEGPAEIVKRARRGFDPAPVRWGNTLGRSHEEIQ